MSLASMINASSISSMLPGKRSALKYFWGPAFKVKSIVAFLFVLLIESPDDKSFFKSLFVKRLVNGLFLNSREEENKHEAFFIIIT